MYAKFSDGNLVLIDCTAYERAFAENMYERSELDWLIYNDPAAYVELVLSKETRNYLKNITQYRRIDT